ncbi:MAG TPA: LEA type 2 family protein [Candidatus Latescibacteria bacterium]|nr:LEA type 2 family protein [Candidatus Latescibacterota bacterium]
MRQRTGIIQQMLGVACLTLFSGGLQAWAAGEPAAKDDIVVALKDKVIRNLSSSGLTLAFHISLTNPSSAPRELVRYRYRVTINQKEFLNMTVSLDEPLLVPPDGETLIALPVKISYDLLRAAVGPVEGQALCDIVGDMYFQNERKKEQRAAFAFSGEFPIFQNPEIEILSLKVNDLTVGGADVVFRPRFRNPNGYELLVDKISFALFFGDRKVLSGQIPEDKSFPRAGEKTFSLPFLIDFFEVGGKMREDFQKDEIPCRFAGEIEVMSVWGRLLIRFDKAQDLRFEKTP